MVSLFFLSQLHPWAEWSCSSWEPSADLATRRGEFLLCCSHSSSSGVSFNIPFHPSPTFLHPHSHFVLFAHGGLVLYLPSPHWAHSTVQKGPDDSVHLVPNSPYRLGPRKWQSDIRRTEKCPSFSELFWAAGRPSWLYVCILRLLWTKKHWFSCLNGWHQLTLCERDGYPLEFSHLGGAICHHEFQVTCSIVLLEGGPYFANVPAQYEASLFLTSFLCSNSNTVFVSFVLLNLPIV